MRAFKISDEQLKILEKYIPNIDEYLNKYINELFSILNDIQVSTMVDDEPTEETYMLEKIYDDLYAEN